MPKDPLTVLLAAALVEVLTDPVRDAVMEGIQLALPDAIRRASLPEYMSRREAATYIGRSERALDSLRSSGKLSYVKRGNRVLVRTSDLDNYLDAGHVPMRSRYEV